MTYVCMTCLLNLAPPLSRAWRGSLNLGLFELVYFKLLCNSDEVVVVGQSLSDNV